MNSDDRAGVLSRFWAKVNKAGPVHPTLGTACWVWTAARVRDGYGLFHPIRTARVYAHRFSYAAEVGQIPDGLFVLHKCDNKWCVRPDHLFTGTQMENIHDMISKGREPECMKVRRLCKRGHDMSANARSIKIKGKAFRRCGACCREHSLAFRLKHADRLRAYHRARYRSMAEENRRTQVGPTPVSSNVVPTERG